MTFGFLLFKKKYRNNHPWYNYLTTDIPRARPPTLIRSTSASGLEESFQKRMTTSVEDNRNSINTDIILKRDIESPQIQNLKVNNIAHNQTTTVLEAKPNLRSGILRNSRYQ